MEIINYTIVNDFPKPGIKFIDMADIYSRYLNGICDELTDNALDCDAILAVESRGFITASVIAYKLNKPLILIRKESNSFKNYILTSPFNNEYASRKFGIPPEVLRYKRVIIVDDLIATGNTINSIIDKLNQYNIITKQVLCTISLRDFEQNIKAPIYYIKEISCKNS